MKYLGLLFLSIMLSACSAASLVQVNNARMPSNVSKTTPTLDAVKNAILRAGEEIGWTMQAEADNTIMGTLTVGKKTAVVTITYTPQTYSINYKDSSNLDYKDSTIDNTYNEWVENLNNAIHNSIHAL